MEQKDLDRIYAELSRPVADRAMTPDQGNQLAQLLSAFGLSGDAPEVKLIMWQVGASAEAWRLRALTVAQANSAIEILIRYAEAGTRPPVGDFDPSKR